MRKLTMLMMLGILAFSASGCATYGDVEKIGKGHVVITKNSPLPFGLFSNVQVCQVKASGLENCQKNEKP